MPRFLLDEARNYFQAKKRQFTLEKLKEIIVLSTQKDDFKAAAACFLLCGLIEFFFKDYISACEFLVQLVKYIL